MKYNTNNSLFLFYWTLIVVSSCSSIHGFVLPLPTITTAKTSAFLTFSRSKRTISTTRETTRSVNNSGDDSIIDCTSSELQNNYIHNKCNFNDGSLTHVTQRRSFLSSLALLVIPPLLTTTTTTTATTAIAAEIDTNSKSTSDAQITSKIYLQFKGIPEDPTTSSSSSSSSSMTTTTTTDTITIGLFGNDAPQPTQIIKQLVSKSGYPAPCKPKEIRTLQREQLEANKVYNACIMSEEAASTNSDSSSSSFGVTYDFSTVWRVIPNERIDLGAVAGKFISREPPLFQLNTDNNNKNGVLKHDSPGVVSVRRGSDGGFGFTIYPGPGSKISSSSSLAAAAELDQENIVIGKVIDGMSVLQRLNAIPVVQSAGAKSSPLSLPFGKSGATATTRNSPSRACRYGSSELYCNEFKPLKKVLITNTGGVD